MASLQCGQCSAPITSRLRHRATCDGCVPAVTFCGERCNKNHAKSAGHRCACATCATTRHGYTSDRRRCGICFARGVVIDDLTAISYARTPWGITVALPGHHHKPEAFTLLGFELPTAVDAFVDRHCEWIPSVACEDCIDITVNTPQTGGAVRYFTEPPAYPLLTGEGTADPAEYRGLLVNQGQVHFGVPSTVIPLHAFDVKEEQVLARLTLMCRDARAVVNPLPEMYPEEVTSLVMVLSSPLLRTLTIDPFRDQCAMLMAANGELWHAVIAAMRRAVRIEREHATVPALPTVLMDLVLGYRSHLHTAMRAMDLVIAAAGKC